ncbi:MAG: hypothetical protein IJ390_05660 [Lachnospiraceae bacterium]|nr:hypothetical protein [Lachnospiraceae bacterium]
MYNYDWIQWLFLFFFYCFFGWCFESSYVSIKNKKMVNRGFIRGPFLPLYGSGALMMLIVSRPFQGNLILTYLAGCVGATILEYVTGVVMEALFKVRYWDYSDQKFNFQGHICLGSSLAWGGLTILMTHVIHKPVEKFMCWLPQEVLSVVTLLTAVYFIADFTLSFKAAMDLRDVLVKMEQAKQELERMQKRLDVIVALIDEAKENRKEELEEAWEEFVQRSNQLTENAKEDYAQRREELVASIEEKFEHLRQNLPIADKLLERRSELREEILDLRSRYRLNQQKSELNQYVNDFIKRSMLKGNPGMASRRFAEALEELKQSAQDYRKKKEDEK